jgi:hypothetical protein
MAPVAPVGRARALAAVRAGTLPLWMGSPHPFVAIVEEDDRFRVRRLVVDAAEADAARTAALAAGRGWMPEDHHALAQPTGEIVIETATRDELIGLLEAIDWPVAW